MHTYLPSFTPRWQEEGKGAGQGRGVPPPPPPPRAPNSTYLRTSSYILHDVSVTQLLHFGWTTQFPPTSTYIATLIALGHARHVRMGSRIPFALDITLVPAAIEGISADGAELVRSFDRSFDFLASARVQFWSTVSCMLWSSLKYRIASRSGSRTRDSVLLHCWRRAAPPKLVRVRR